jgi:membrane-associated phospholipid phosphatase
MASAISMARCTGKNHYPSDVVVGGVLGYLIGHYVSHRQAPLTFSWTIRLYLNPAEFIRQAGIMNLFAATSSTSNNPDPSVRL